jgi:hypothetical protein
VSDLLPAAGLHWALSARPRALFADPSLLPALLEAVPAAELDALAARFGGVDPRAADEIAVAEYDGATVALVHEVVDPARLEKAFAEYVPEVEGRALDRRSDDPRGVVVRLWGTLDQTKQTLVVFGREGAGFASGDDKPLRASELFAAGKLRKARPAWTAPPLDGLGAALGDPPLRFGAAGPFAIGESGFGAVLGGATAAGVAATPEGDALRVTVALVGPWNDRAADVGVRLERRFDALAASGFGRLAGLDRPVVAPKVTAAAGVVGFEVVLRAVDVLVGLRDATSSQVDGIMRHSGPARAPSRATDRSIHERAD